ncbi:MAG: flagellar biosynthesis anti-sigma factor FlgM [Lachnospiraceae bacterium]|nr:flagellar biosynthesis anti-sigma factor FlgM [Lachnospiraceae bacterium]
MRIEAYTQVQQLYNAKKATQTKNTTVAKLSDQLQISSVGKDIQTAKAALAQTPDIREDVAAVLKAKIDAGSYQVSADSFADKLMQKYEEMR